MDRIYERINWENEPSIVTPINDVNLNKMDSAIYQLDGRTIELDTTKAKESDALLMFNAISYDDATGKFTFTRKNGTTVVVDTLLEKVVTNFTYDAVTQQLVLTTPEGEVRVDMSALITQYEFENTTTVAFNVVDGKVQATVIDGSITSNKLQPDYLADITTQATAASHSATSADTSANLSNVSKQQAEAWSNGTIDGVPVDESNPAYHNNAKYWSSQAAVTTLEGLTDTDINNPTNGQALVYENGVWINGAGGGGSVPDNVTLFEAGDTNQLKDKNGNNLIPITKTKAVSDDAGNRLDNTLTNLTNLVNNKASANLVSDAYNSSTTYSEGQYCIYNNILWRSKVSNNAGNTPTENSYWTATNVGKNLVTTNGEGKFGYLGADDSFIPFKSGGGSEPVLLWENPNPTGAFSAQTINLDLSEYAQIIIMAYTSTIYQEKSAYQATVLIPIDGETHYIYTSEGALSKASNLRAVTANSNGVTFGTGNATGSNNNQACIPYKIWGVPTEFIIIEPSNFLTGNINTNGKTYIGNGQELSQIFIYQTTGSAMIEFDSSYNSTQYRQTINGAATWNNLATTNPYRYAIGKDSGGYYYYDTNASAYPLRYFAVVK